MKYVSILDYDPNVLDFEYEPISINYYFNGHKKIYTPDFMVNYIDGSSEIIEIKPYKLLELDINKAKFEAIRKIYSNFRVITEIDLFV